MRVHLFVIAATTLAVILVFGAILYVVGMWLVFKRMGRHGWLSLIPVYNVGVLYSVSEVLKLYPAFLVCLFAFLFMSTQSEELLLTLAWIPVALMFVLHVIQNIKLATVFDRSRLFALGLILLTPVFLTALGLGKGELPPDEEEI